MIEPVGDGCIQDLSRLDWAVEGAIYRVHGDVGAAVDRVVDGENVRETGMNGVIGGCVDLDDRTDRRRVGLKAERRDPRTGDVAAVADEHVISVVGVSGDQAVESGSERHHRPISTEADHVISRAEASARAATVGNSEPLDTLRRERVFGVPVEGAVGVGGVERSSGQIANPTAVGTDLGAFVSGVVGVDREGFSRWQVVDEDLDISRRWTRKSENGSAVRDRGDPRAAVADRHISKIVFSVGEARNRTVRHLEDVEVVPPLVTRGGDCVAGDICDHHSVTVDIEQCFAATCAFDTDDWEKCRRARCQVAVVDLEARGRTVLVFRAKHDIAGEDSNSSITTEPSRH